jgi:hypothetical protein
MEIYSITTAVKRLVNTASFVILRKYERRKMPIFLKSPFTKFCRQIFYFVAIGANGDRQREPWCRCLVEGGVIWHCFVVVFAPHLDITYQKKINVYILHNYIQRFSLSNWEKYPYRSNWEKLSRENLKIGKKSGREILKLGKSRHEVWVLLNTSYSSYLIEHTH